MKKQFRKMAKISLVLVYLVIMAGAVVRMTGSGMGCPDWPKCFGYYIPPTEIGQLLWQPARTFKKGQLIIRNDSLLVSREDHITAEKFDEKNWAPYTKHSYAVFNALHTWTEFINRLLGALAGLATFIMALFSIGYWKQRSAITIIAWIVVLAMGFQAWLGATVVFSVLEPVKITLHMAMALGIVALLLYLIFSSGTQTNRNKYDRKTIHLLFVALCLTAGQIVLGTQVREFVDMQIELLGAQAKAIWLQDASITFYIHRSFSILLLLINLWLLLRIQRLKLGFDKIKWVMLLLILEVFTGIAMNYLAFPGGSQPVHLVVATLLFAVQFYLVMEALNLYRIRKTL